MYVNMSSACKLLLQGFVSATFMYAVQVCKRFLLVFFCVFFLSSKYIVSHPHSDID